MRQKYVIIESYQDLYDQVKEIKDKYNFHMDTFDLVDTLIFDFFSRGGVNALDSCYEKFKQKLQEEKMRLKMEDGEIKLEEK